MNNRDLNIAWNFKQLVQQRVMPLGVLMVREAGGVVTIFDGSAYDVFNDKIVASNGLIHDRMVTMLAAVAAGVSI